MEADGCGWDLEAVSPEGDILLVEVKGLSGSEVVVELTPNEYSKMIGAKNRAMYVVYIVTDAISDANRSHVFRHDTDASTPVDLIWAAEDGRKLKIKPLIAARLSAAPAR